MRPARFRRLSVLSGAAALACCLSLPAAAAADLEAGRRTFEALCATCHGVTGRPDPANPVVQGLGVEPADLSDALFNSREPANDWLIVVRHGGQALGLSEAMPAQGGVLGDQEIRDVVAYAKTLADTRRYPPGELNMMLPVRTKKAFPEDEVVWKSRWTDQEGEDVWRNVLEIEKRVGRRGQVLLEVAHEDTGDSSEIEEVQVGYKQALRWSLDRRSILSGSLLLAVPTDSGVSEELIAGIAYGQWLSDRATFQGSARAALPLDEPDGGAVELAGVVHWVWSQWPRRVFPALELTATVPFERGDGDAVQWTVVPQLRFGLTRGAHVALNLGVEVPLSDQSYDYRWHLNLLWDFADGSFFKGW